DEGVSQGGHRGSLEWFRGLFGKYPPRNAGRQGDLPGRQASDPGPVDWLWSLAPSSSANAERRTPMPSRLVAPISLLALLACATTEAPAPTPDPEVARAAVDSVLTALHQTASEGAWDLYFALYAPDAVFFGTDATERWSLE